MVGVGPAVAVQEAQPGYSRRRAPADHPAMVSAVVGPGLRANCQEILQPAEVQAVGLAVRTLLVVIQEMAEMVR